MKFRTIREAGLLDLAYDADTFDCGDFFMLAQERLFHRNIVLPGKRERGARGQATLGTLSLQYAERTESPVEGDIVLTRTFGDPRPTHIGVYVMLDYQPYMLHCNDRPFPVSRCDKIADLIGHGLIIEGYYTWKLA
jgi:hypothetical protein